MMKMFKIVLLENYDLSHFGVIADIVAILNIKANEFRNIKEQYYIVKDYVKNFGYDVIYIDEDGELKNDL